MLQRLAVARALLHDPSVLLFDEPFTGLDQQGTAMLAAVLKRLKAEARLCLIVTHDLASIASITDHVVVMAKGKIAHESRSAQGVPGFTHEELQQFYQRHA